MKSSLLVISVAAALFFGCHDQDTVHGSGRLVDEARPVATISSVDIGDGLPVSITVGEPSLRLAIDENILPFVRTEVRGSVLSLGGADRTFLPSAGSLVRVVMPSIDGLNVSGSSHVTAAMRGEAVAIEGAESCDLDIEAEATREITSDASGNARVLLRGTSPLLRIEASGSASVESRVPSKEARVVVSGSSHVTVHASDRVVIEASGASEVLVHGHPQVRDVDTSGTASVVYVD